MTDRSELRSVLDRAARRLGFAAWGVAEAGPSRSMDRLRAWLDWGYHGDMAWMTRNLDLRADPRGLMPGIRSVLVFADSTRTANPEAHDGSVIAKYACGNDYHRVMKGRMLEVVAELRKCEPKLKARVLADSAPVLEHEWALRAGLGWIGRNSLTIHPKAGSHLTLGTVWVNVDMDPDAPATNHCGNCRACIEACPTGAIVDDAVVDARRCLSYLTIEKEGPFGADEKNRLGSHVFGCDICQDVCPWNHRPPSPPRPAEYGELFEGKNPEEIRTVLKAWVERPEAFEGHLGPTPLSRAGIQGIARNLQATEPDNGEEARS